MTEKTKKTKKELLTDDIIYAFYLALCGARDTDADADTLRSALATIRCLLGDACEKSNVNINLAVMYSMGVTCTKAIEAVKDMINGGDLLP